MKLTSSVDNVQSTNLSKPNEMNTISTGVTKIMDVSKLHDSNSSENAPSAQYLKYANVLRSKRPLKKMGMYTDFKTHGIVLESVVAAFKREKNRSFHQMEKERKANPSYTDPRLVRKSIIFLTVNFCCFFLVSVPF